MPDLTEPTSTGAEVALSVRNLSVRFGQGDRAVKAVQRVSYDVARGQVLAVVGESGSGKSASALACLGLLPTTAQVTGQIMVAGHDMVAAPEHQREQVRGGEIAMVFQDALASLNPYQTIGKQIAQAYLLRHPASKAAAWARAVEVLEQVGLREPAQQAKKYPHEFSGGMRQRAMIAMAVVNSPRVLIADEPTTALDVTVQAQVLDLLVDLVRGLDMAMVLITHDLGVVAEVADEVAVMYAGRIVEKADVMTLFENPTHPYTVGLQASVPRLDDTRTRLISLPGAPASGVNPPAGCAFHPRCPVAAVVGEDCRTQVPELTRRGLGSLSACHASVEEVTRAAGQ